MQGAVVREVLAGGPAAAAGILPATSSLRSAASAIANDCDFDVAAFGRACEPVAVAFRRPAVNLERNVSPVRPEPPFYEKALRRTES